MRKPDNKFDVSKRYVIEVDGQLFPASEYELHAMYLQIGRELGLAGNGAPVMVEPTPDSSPYAGERNPNWTLENRVLAHEVDKLREELAKLRAEVADRFNPWNLR